MKTSKKLFTPLETGHSWKAVKSLTGFTLNTLIGVLFIALIFSCGWAVYAVFFVGEYLYEGKILEPLEESKAGLRPGAKQKDYPRFLSEIARKNIFVLPYAKGFEPERNINREKIDKIIENLRLAGIKSGGSMKVIIENKRIGKTFYLKEGDSFSEDILVEKINKDSVVLNCHGESYEIYL